MGSELNLGLRSHHHVRTLSDFESESPIDSQQIAAFLSKEGQLLLSMVNLVEQAQCAVDEVIDVMGRATIEAILQMSAKWR